MKLNQTLENNLKVSVGNDMYSLTKYDKIQITDTKIIKAANNGSYFSQNWVLKSNDKNGNDKLSNFIKSTKTNNPTGHSGATSLLPIGDSFLYLETSSNNNRESVFVNWEKTDVIQITNITFYYNRSSAGGTKSMGCFRVQLRLDDNTWSTR